MTDHHHVGVKPDLLVNDYIHVGVKPELLGQAWIALIRNKNRIGWTGLTLNRREMSAGGIASPNYGGDWGTNPMTAYTEQEIYAKLDSICGARRQIYRSADIEAATISFFEPDAEFAMEIALRYGSGLILQNKKWFTFE